MGRLVKMVTWLRGNRDKEEGKKLLEELRRTGESDAEKIAKKMGQTEDKKGFVQRVDVSSPVVMPVEEQTEERDDDDRTN